MLTCVRPLLLGAAPLRSRNDAFNFLFSMPGSSSKSTSVSNSCGSSVIVEYGLDCLLVGSSSSGSTSWAIVLRILFFKGASGWSTSSTCLAFFFFGLPLPFLAVISLFSSLCLSKSARTSSMGTFALVGDLAVSIVCLLTCRPSLEPFSLLPSFIAFSNSFEGTVSGLNPEPSFATGFGAGSFAPRGPRREGCGGGALYVKLHAHNKLNAQSARKFWQNKPMDSSHQVIPKILYKKLVKTGKTSDRFCSAAGISNLKFCCPFLKSCFSIQILFQPFIFLA